MNMTKKFPVFLLSVALLFLFCACEKTSASIDPAEPENFHTPDVMRGEKDFEIISLSAKEWDSEGYQAALRLNELGLFIGVGKNADGTPNFDLDRAPTREEAATMLVRMFGDEEAALQLYELGEYECPFIDVAQWARPYVAYACDRGFVQGDGGYVFGGAFKVTASEYLTFILRAMGYVSGTDFQWDRAWELSDRLGITDGQYNETSNYSFARKDVVIVTLNALRICKPIQLNPTNSDGLELIATYNPNGLSWDGFLLTPMDSISDLCIVEIGDMDDNGRFAAGNVLYSIGNVEPGQAVRVVLDPGEMFPLWGVVLKDSGGYTRGFTVFESGMDGSTGLLENIHF